MTKLQYSPLPAFRLSKGSETTKHPNTKLFPYFSWTKCEGLWEIAFPHMMHFGFFMMKGKYDTVPWKNKISKVLHY